jgi:hypothetical protein
VATYSVTASAEIILSASASETATFDNFLLTTPLAVLILHCQAQTVAAFPVAAYPSIVLSARASAGGGFLTVSRTAGAILVLRCRADVPGMLPHQVEDYLGRYQQGDEVPLQLQCFAAAETAGLPDAAPIVRIYREGVLADEFTLPLLPDAQVSGRFGQNYRLGYLTAPGRYLAAYWYQASDVVQAQQQVFEVMPGGDPGGPVLATQVIGRPDGDRVLAQVASGALLVGQDPYLDEGV